MEVGAKDLFAPIVVGLMAVADVVALEVAEAVFVVAVALTA